VLRRPGDLVDHVVGPLFICGKVRTEKIREEKKLQYRKHDKQFNEDDLPQGLSDGHRPETVTVKPQYPIR
jgi:hypothetical protein